MPPKKNSRAKTKDKPTYQRPNRLAKMSKRGFALLFIIPFILAELLFYFGERQFSMMLFPFLWVGFWAALLWANDWVPLRKPKTKKNTE